MMATTKIEEEKTGNFIFSTVIFTCLQSSEGGTDNGNNKNGKK